MSVLRGLTGIESAEAHGDGVQVHPNGVPASAVVAALVGAGIPVDRVGAEPPPGGCVPRADRCPPREEASSMTRRGRPAQRGRARPQARAAPPATAPGRTLPLRGRDDPAAAPQADHGGLPHPAGAALDPGRRVRARRPAAAHRHPRPGRPRHHRRAQLRRVQLLRLRGLPARGRGGAVLRGHRGQRGELGVAAVPARGPGAPGPAAAPEAGGGAGLLDRRRDQLPGYVADRGHGGVRLAPAQAARHRGGSSPPARRWPGWASCWATC